MQVWSLSWKGPLEEEMATHSSILAGIIPRPKEPGGLCSTASQRVSCNSACNQILYLCILSHVWFFATQCTIAHQEFSRQEYWNGLSFPTPGNLSDRRIKPMSPASPVLAGRVFITLFFITLSLYHCATWEAQYSIQRTLKSPHKNY